jgi:8-oxo-dGTP diphosphatase
MIIMDVVRVGVGVMMLRDRNILLGKRHDDPEKADSLLHGEGTWTFPGGKADFQEGLLDTLVREIKEETDMNVDPTDLKLFSVTNDRVPDNHFVTIGFLTEKFMGDPKVMEPDEITEWKWFPLDELPEKMFFPCKKMVQNYMANEVYKH